MTNEEYVKTVTYNDVEIKVGLDDYGQSYFIEYIDNDTGAIITETIGCYISDYMGYIYYRFGEPKINCDYYDKCKWTNKQGCDKLDKDYCSKCEKRWCKKDYKAWLKRVEKFDRWLKKHGKNIT